MSLTEKNHTRLSVYFELLALSFQDIHTVQQVHNKKDARGLFLPHENAPDSASSLHVAADVCEALVEGFPPPFLVLGSFGPIVFVDAGEINVNMG